MRTFSMLKGLPVYTNRGECIGTVNDICLSDIGKIEGIMVHRKAIVKKRRFVSLNDVHSFGPEGIVLKQWEDSQHGYKPKVHYHLFHADCLFGKMLFSRAGEELGMLQDVYFLENLGTIVAYETTDGFFSELTEGTRLIKSKQPPVLGKDAILISVYDQ
ncbi:PRC-barrel domain-containing protein [Bacillus sp. V5-8f]|uniref:PRC-barrel domain-containing protein n=1 Tax=Bacillus sp. V5-8f TaxID=2053044 RepID=UPI0015E15A7A|nr:PRC-barrel domain-containing protein [Bacillus sp. V5-8f]